jgi:acyl phosphate:glycerol-3-phosphate acyltransferase
MPELLTKVVLAYLLGSVLASIVLGRLMGVDVRGVGSGNPGATNALRARGWGFALAVLGLDLAKGVLAVLLIASLAWPWSGAAETGLALWLPAVCGVAAVVGHVWPIWHGFDGGKGAATLLGCVAAVMPMALIPMLAVWLGGAVATGYVGLFTVLAAVSVAVWAVLVPADGILAPEAAFAILMALLMIYTHRQHLLNTWQGTEHRFESFMIWRRLLRRD